MTFQEILTNLMTEHDISNKALANEVGVSEEAVRKWRNGLSLPAIDKAGKVADFFRISLDYLSGRSTTEQVVSLPLLGSVSAGPMTIETSEGTDSGEHRNVLRSDLHGRSAKNCVLLEISGDSMEPLYRKGDVVIVHRQPEAYNGNIVVAYDAVEGGYTVKEFFRTADRVELRAFNPKYKPFRYTNPEWAELRIFGVCLGILGKSLV